MEAGSPASRSGRCVSEIKAIRVIATRYPFVDGVGRLNAWLVGPSPGGRMHRQRIYERDAHTCQFCGNGASSLDHLVPKRHGGQDRWENLVAACGTCNRNKGEELYPDLADEVAALILARRTMQRGHPPLLWQVRARGRPHEQIEVNPRHGGWFDRTLAHVVFAEPGRRNRRVRRRHDLAVAKLSAAVPGYDPVEARRELDRLVAEGLLGTTPRFYVDRTSSSR